MGPTRTKKTDKADTEKEPSFKWAPETKMAMAEYVRSNYESYKKALSSSKKIRFLRTMRDELKIPCNDGQLRNGFTHFLSKYTEVETQLSKSGFGVDPDKDATLNTGWILEKCPYYFILNEVMGSRPNLRPPHVISTTAAASTTPASNSSSLTEEQNDEGERQLEGLDDDDDDDNSEKDVPENTSEVPKDAPTTESSAYMKQMLADVKAKRDSMPKTPLALFGKIMADKTEESAKIEREKLKAEKEYRDEEKELQRQKLQFEIKKFEAQTEIQEKRLKLDEQAMLDRKAEREHEILKLKLQYDFELKKLGIANELPVTCETVASTDPPTSKDP